jgi:hypothetical protein
MYWDVSIWESTRLLKRCTIPVGKITEVKLKELLRVLTAKYSLRDEEIIPCFQRRKTRGYSALLEVHHSFKPIGYSCGVNPYSYARIVKAR